MVDIPFVVAPGVRTGAGGPFPAGTTVSITWAASRVDAPCGSYGYAVQMGSDVEFPAEVHYAADGLGHTLTHTFTSAAAYVVFAGYTDAYCSTGALLGVTTTPGGTTGVCQYGTQQQGGSPAIVALLPDAILAIVGAVTDGWGWAAAAFFAGQNINVANLCSIQRPSEVTLTQADIINLTAFPPGPLSVPAIAKANQWFQWAAWPYFCQCVTGSPLPTPPAIIVQPAPTGIATGDPTALVCSNEDICTTLSKIARQITALTQIVVQVATSTTLIQRQSVPFAYVPGTLHSGLSGAGTITIAGVLGLSVQTTSLPGYLGSDMAPVASWFKLGELSLGNTDGWAARRIVTHNPHLFLDLDADLTTVGYLFEPGITANILELIREP